MRPVSDAAFWNVHTSWASYKSVSPEIDGLLVQVKSRIRLCETQLAIT